MFPLKKIRKLFSGPKAVVLMYHRIGRPETDPWQLFVEEENFGQQLAVLKDEYDVIPVEELVRRLNRRKLEKNCVCITFDDGYRDNYSLALPLLKKHSCPATFFITTGGIDKEQMFWWDKLGQIFLLQKSLPPVLKLAYANTIVDYVLDNNGALTEDDMTKHRQWLWPQPPPTMRSSIYLEIWQKLKIASAEEISRLMEFISAWAEARTSIDDIPMTTAQLRELTSETLFSTGVHTVTHAALGAQPYEIQEMELSRSRSFLYENFSGYADVVAYPYGHYNLDTLKVVKTNNFEAAFTTVERTINANSNVYELGRFQVKNWNGTAFSHQLSKWFES